MVGGNIHTHIVDAFTSSAHKLQLRLTPSVMFPCTHWLCHRLEERNKRKKDAADREEEGRDEVRRRIAPIEQSSSSGSEEKKEDETPATPDEEDQRLQLAEQDEDDEAAARSQLHYTYRLFCHRPCLSNRADMPHVCLSCPSIIGLLLCHVMAADTTLIYIQFIRFARRCEGTDAARSVDHTPPCSNHPRSTRLHIIRCQCVSDLTRRLTRHPLPSSPPRTLFTPTSKVFSASRKYKRLTYHAYVFAALLEWQVNKNVELASKIFHAGLDKYDKLSGYIDRYVEWLRVVGDHANLRLVVERVVKEGEEEGKKRRQREEDERLKGRTKKRRGGGGGGGGGGRREDREDMEDMDVYRAPLWMFGRSTGELHDAAMWPTQQTKASAGREAA